MPTFWFWPNVDAGSDFTSSGIRHFRETENLNNVRFFKNMTPEDFLKLVNGCECLIGNSSVGIRECAFMGVKVVNIGKRQERRDRGKNVIDVNYNACEIKEAVESQLNSEKPQCDYIYGEGKSGKEIAKVLSEVKLRFSKILSY